MPSPSQPSSPPLRPVLWVHFIGMLGYSLVMPFLVFLVEKFGGNGFIYGIMGAIYPGFQLLGAPILGGLSDTWGRRRVLLLSQGGTLLAWGLFMGALLLPVETLWSVDSSFTGEFVLTVPLFLLFIARALDGLTGGNVSVANAYVADVSTEETRKANFGKMAMAASLGFILGPAIAGVLGTTAWEELLPVMAAAGISIIALILIQTQMPETQTQPVDPKLPTFNLRKIFHVEQKPCYKRANCPETGLRAILKLPNIPLLFSMYFFSFLGFSLYYASFPVFALQVLTWNSFQLGIFFTTLSGMMVLVQGPLLGYLSKRFSEIPLIIFGAFFLATNFLLISLGEVYAVYMAAGFFALGNGIMWPSFLSLLSQAGEKKMQGTIQGYGESAGSFASILGMILGGLLFSWVGVSVFWISAFFLMAVGICTFFLPQQKNPYPR